MCEKGLIVHKDPDAPHERLLGVSKCNLCEPPRVLRYEIEAEGKTSRVLWLGETDADVEKLFAEESGNDDAAGDDAEEFLKALLAQGPVPATQVVTEAAELHIKDSRLRRAKRRLRIESCRVAATDRPGMRWVWCMPTPPKSEAAE
jgi:putative DNA primase/helicase